MKKTIGIMFPGYGEQFIGMGKDVYDTSRLMQDIFEQASMCMGINFVQLCFAASDFEITSIDKGYLAILLLETALYNELAQAGLRPDFIAGYGIGEYAAAVASGSLSFTDSAYILNKYAQLLQDFFAEHSDYAILQITRGFTLELIEAYCKEVSTQDKKIFIAAYNSEQDFYVAGDRQLILEMEKYCKKHKIRKVKMLTPAYELHNNEIDSVVDKLAPYYFKIDFKPLKTPVITNVDGVYVTSSDALESAIIRRINAPVLWDEVMNGFIGCDVLLSVGPGKQLEQWAQLKYPEKEIYTIESLADLKALEPLLQEHRQSHVQSVDAQHDIDFGTCHLEESITLPSDLTQADLINELPGDYDIED